MEGFRRVCVSADFSAHLAPACSESPKIEYGLQIRSLSASPI